MTIETLILDGYHNKTLQGATITPYGVYLPLRVTGIGYSIRFNDRDNAYISKRDDSYLKLQQEIVGLPIIVDHPQDNQKKDNINASRFLTLSNFDNNKIIGMCLNAYENDGELWAITKLYDINTALDLINENKSTSPAVYCVFDNDGRALVDTPLLINHLAIVEQGHWDKEDRKAVDNSKINILELKDKTMQQALKEKSITPCLVDDYRYLNKGIPSFFGYNTRDAEELKEANNEDAVSQKELESQQKQKEELLNSTIDKEQDMADIKELEKDTKATRDDSERGYERDDDKRAQELDREIAKDKRSDRDDRLYEEDDRTKRDREREDALRDKEKAKDDDLVRVDKGCMADDEIGYYEPYGDDDRLRDEILGVMEELADTLNDSLRFKKVVCSKRERPEFLVNRLLKANLALCDSAYKKIIESDRLKEFGTDFTKKVFSESVKNIKILNDSANKKQGKRHADLNGWVKIGDGISIKSLR